jgi:multimeric flavodoxin WrbA
MSERRVLGLACGQPDGSAEILLKAALIAAEVHAAVELVRLEDLDLEADAAWFWEKLVECDGLIVSAPIISRTVPGRLKALGDILLGPNADAAIVRAMLEPGAPALPFRVDERVLKPRVAGFIAVGGSLTTQWKALALPVLHTLTFSMQTAVVDQVVFAGAGTPRSIVLDPDTLDRAARLGRNVAEQIGRPFAQAEYRGDDPGLCPHCHLDVVVLRGTQVECATCGARGTLGVEGGKAVVRFGDEGSVITMAEKREHFFEIQETARRHAERRDEIESRARAYDAYDRRIAPGSSTRPDSSSATDASPISATP